ncbi:hypothetical protein [Globicatella sanguinis]
MFEAYSTVRGRTNEAKIIQFLLLVHSQLCGGEQTKRKLFNFYFWSTPNCAVVGRRSENHSIFYFWSTPNCAGVNRRSGNY